MCREEGFDPMRFEYMRSPSPSPPRGDAPVDEVLGFCIGHEIWHVVHPIQHLAFGRWCACVRACHFPRVVMWPLGVRERERARACACVRACAGDRVRDCA